MKKELCFIFDDEKIYLEQSLVEYECIPIYFLCKSSSSYYIALCSDFDNFSYVVTKITMKEVYELLHGKISMRKIITDQKFYWDILSGESIEQDIVMLKEMNKLDETVLPIEGAVFEILSESIRKYVEKFDSEYFSGEFFEKIPAIDNSIYMAENLSLDDMMENVNIYIELSNCSLHIDTKSIFNDVSYNEQMDNTKIVKNTINDNKTKDSYFDSHLYTSEILIAA